MKYVIKYSAAVAYASAMIAEAEQGMDDQHAAAVHLKISLNVPTLVMIRNRAARSV
jgi:hypothetical protein